MTDRNVVIRLRGDVGDFPAKMAAAGRSVGGVVDKMTSGEKESKKFRDGLLSVGDAGGKIGLGAAAALGGIIGVTANFEQKMSAVQAATHESAAAMEQLREAAVQAGAETSFSASEAAEGVENLAKAGVKTADILGGGLQGALDLAAAGTVDVAFAAETAATAMTQFGLAGDQVPHIADLLAAAAGKAQGEVSDMAYALRQSGLVANQVGLSIEETTAGLAAFASQGLLGSDAGTSFKTMLSSLTPNSEKAAAAMERVGLAAYDANGNFVGLEAVAKQLRTGMADLTAEQRQSTLETIFGSDAVRAASVLYDQGAQGIREWTDAVNDQGFAAETAAIKLDNLKGDFEALKGALETAFINMGTDSQGGLRGLTQGATDAVNAFNGLPGAMQGTVTKMLAITAITGGGLWFGSRMIRTISDTREAIENLGPAGQRAGSALRAGLTIGPILMASYGALDLLLNRLEDAADLNFDDTNIQRFVDSLALGQANGDMETLANNINNMSSGMNQFGHALVGWAPGNDAIEQAEKNIGAIDEVLAALVESGNAEQAARAFATIQSEAEKVGAVTGREIGDASRFFDAYTQALEIAGEQGYISSVGFRSTGKAIEETERVTGTAARGIEGVGDAAAGAATAAEQLDTALGDLEVTLNARSKNRSYEESLDAIAERLKDRRELIEEVKDAEAEVANAKTKDERSAAEDRLASLREELRGFTLTLDDGREAGREWNTLLDGVAKNALETAQTMDAADQPGFLNQARRNFIRLATDITGSRKKAEELANELDLVHQKKVKPKIEVDTKPAENDVRKFYRWLEGLPPARVKMFVDNLLDTQEGKLANGGRTPGFANGGYTGAMPVDAIAGVVHGREFVHDAVTTSMFRPLFEYIHQHRRLPGYQSGGYVQQISQPVTNNYGAQGIDYDRLARAMQMVRPLYGDVTVNGDGSFEREIRARRRSRAGGGR